MYEKITKLVDKAFSEANFKTGFFTADDLVGDIYLHLSEIDQELSEQEITGLIKNRYFGYFDIYDIKDKKSYDKFESSGNQGVKEGSIEQGTQKEAVIYEHFENIIWKEGKHCPKCKSKEVYPSEKNIRQHDCRKCGHSFSFSTDTNLKGVNSVAMKNLLMVYNLLLSGTLCFKAIHDRTGLSPKEIKKAYVSSLPAIINNEDLIRKEKIIKPLSDNKVFEEHEHQTKTISEAVEYFKANSRGKIIHPCGSGKTYTAIQIAKKLEAKRIVVVIPSKVLLKQQIDTFVPYFPNHKFYAFGSLQTHAKEFKTKKIVFFDQTVTKQRAAIKTIDAENVVIFTTLKSFTQMNKDFGENYFDLAIFDEAHRVAGEEYKMFLKVIDFDCYVKALFLTATEKNYVDGNAVGMNSPLFGDTISKIYMRDMIDKGVICDYNIVNMSFKDETLKEVLQENEEFFIDVKVKLPVKTRILMSALALLKSMETYPIKKVITYHATIQESVLFINVFKMFLKKYDVETGCYNLHSEMTEFNFKANLYNFIRSESAVISSVNCFQEGIDVVDVDAVLYGYPKKSKIDIPQSVGRCVRISPGKEKGYVIVPAPAEDKSYSKLVSVLSAMETTDDRISEFKVLKKQSEYSKNIIFSEYTPSANLIFDDKFFYESFYITRKDFLSYEEAVEYLRGKFNSSAEYQQWSTQNDFPHFLPKHPMDAYPEWKNWGSFLGQSLRTYNTVSYEDCKKFAKEHGIKSGEQWKKLNKPFNIPKSPDIFYKKEWVSWLDFLDKIFLPWEDAKEFLRDKEIKTRREYMDYLNNSGVTFLAKAPNQFYKEWTFWGDYLSSTTQQRSKQKFTYEEAKEYIAAVNGKSGGKIKSIGNYDKFVKKELLPEMHSNKLYCDPKLNYGKTFISWQDYLGNDELRTRGKYYDYKQTSNWCKENNIKTCKEFRDFKKPPYIVASVHHYFKEWEGWPEFLQTKKEYWSYKDSSNWVKENNIKTWDQFKEWFKEGKIPKEIPLALNRVYVNEWIDWRVFSQEGREERGFLSYEDSKRWVVENNITTVVKTSTLWRKYIDGDLNLEVNPRLPKWPSYFYKNKDEWVSWDDFLNRK